ncbi:MAG TPA: hypothetical protein VK787_07160 [Puia sp.]|jgi:hypothetical protein|nr:hypothetical protein [Puia sp.]
MKKDLLFLFIIIITSSCRKNSAPGNELSGTYNEVFPDAGNTHLNFINSSQVIISGVQLNSQTVKPLNLNAYQINGQRIFFISDSANKKDTTALWFELEGSDVLILTSCPPGAPCAYSITYFIFKK